MMEPCVAQLSGLIDDALGENFQMLLHNKRAQLQVIALHYEVAFSMH